MLQSYFHCDYLRCIRCLIFGEQTKNLQRNPNKKAKKIRKKEKKNKVSMLSLTFAEPKKEEPEQQEDTDKSKESGGSRQNLFE